LLFLNRASKGVTILLKYLMFEPVDEALDTALLGGSEALDFHEKTPQVRSLDSAHAVDALFLSKQKFSTQQQSQSAHCSM
jgi:hypothetical protein